jgi:glycerophosphoryl diester phosphodiesterase
MSKQTSPMSKNSLKFINKVTYKDSSLNRVSFDSTKRFKEKRKPFIECHRGLCCEEEENSLSTFKKSIEMKFDSIELDVWLDKNKIPIVLHGTECGRINLNSEKLINEQTLEELSAIHLLSKKEPIPLLDEVLQLCKDKIFVNIEIKDTNFSECLQLVLNTVNQYEMNNQIAISSFLHSYWEELKNINRFDVEFGFLYDTSEGQSVEFVLEKERQNSTINVWYKEINPEFVKNAHDCNIAVQCWFSRHDDETEDILKYIIDCDVDVICTNHPTKVLKIRDEIFK